MEIGDDNMEHYYEIELYKVSSELDWNRYKFYKDKYKDYVHFGEPEQFPCLVDSIILEGYVGYKDTIHHRFIYQNKDNWFLSINEDWKTKL